MKQYFVITKDGEDIYYSVKTEKELAELWDMNDECGYLDEIIAYTYDAEKRQMEQVNVYDIACAYLNERRAIQEEYEEYTEYVNEYGYDYRDEMPEDDDEDGIPDEPCMDDLEMGFNPYIGTYDYDC